MKITDYDKYYIQGSDHYLIPKDEFTELFNEMANWREECKQLKDNKNKTITHEDMLQKRVYELSEENNRLKEPTCKCFIDGLVCLEKEMKKFEKYKNNWETLKKWLENNTLEDLEELYSSGIETISNKMQELEKSVSDE